MLYYAMTCTHSSNITLSSPNSNGFVQISVVKATEQHLIFVGFKAVLLFPGETAHKLLLCKCSYFTSYYMHDIEMEEEVLLPTTFVQGLLRMYYVCHTSAHACSHSSPASGMREASALAYMYIIL